MAELLERQLACERLPLRFHLVPFPPFGCVASVVIKMASDMSPTGNLLVTSIFVWEVSS